MYGDRKERPWDCPFCKMRRWACRKGRVTAKEEVKNNTLEGSLKPFFLAIQVSQIVSLYQFKGPNLKD